MYEWQSLLWCSGFIYTRKGVESPVFRAKKNSTPHPQHPAPQGSRVLQSISWVSSSLMVRPQMLMCRWLPLLFTDLWQHGQRTFRRCLIEIVLSFASACSFVQYFFSSHAVSRGGHYFLWHCAFSVPGKQLHTCRYKLAPTKIVIRLVVLLDRPDFELTDTCEPRFKLLFDCIVWEPVVLGVVYIQGLVDQSREGAKTMIAWMYDGNRVARWYRQWDSVDYLHTVFLVPFRANWI